MKKYLIIVLIGLSCTAYSQQTPVRTSYLPQSNMVFADSLSLTPGYGDLNFYSRNYDNVFRPYNFYADNNSVMTYVYTMYATGQSSVTTLPLNSNILYYNAPNYRMNNGFDNAAVIGGLLYGILSGFGNNADDLTLTLGKK